MGEEGEVTLANMIFFNCTIFTLPWNRIRKGSMWVHVWVLDIYLFLSFNGLVMGN